MEVPSTDPTFLFKVDLSRSQSLKTFGIVFLLDHHLRTLHSITLQGFVLHSTFQSHCFPSGFPPSVSLNTGQKMAGLSEFLY